MKRIGRYIFNALTVLSLLLCIAAGVTWIRSYWSSDFVQWNRHRGWMGATSGRGRLLLYRSYIISDDIWQQVARPSFFTYGRMRLRGFEGNLTSDTVLIWEGLGARYLAIPHPERIGSSEQLLALPIWMIALPPAALASFGLPRMYRRGRRTRRRVRGLCPICGYDLRATPDRCPECGNVPAKATA